MVMIRSSGALHLSTIPFLRPTGAVRVGRINNDFVVMPTHSELEESELDLVVAGTRDAITMIEGFAREMSEENMLQAILYAHQHIAILVDMIEDLRRQAGLEPKPPPPPAPVHPLMDLFRQRFYD